MNSSPPIIVASRMDPASQNIAQTLKAQHSFTEIDRAGSAKIYRSGEVSLVVIEKQCIHADPDDIPLRGSSVIFASKHVSEAQRPAITVHATGNLTKQAEFGGRPEEVSYVEPFRLKTALRRLKEEAAKARVQIEVTMEATHHGPTSFVIPIFFLEIGSAPKEWSDTKLGEIASNAIMAATRSADTKGTNVVGFGGAHYSAKHTRIALEEDYQIGHIVSKYALEAGVSESTLKDTFSRTIGGCKTALVDWKGIRGDLKRRLVDQLTNWKIEIVRF